MPSKVEFGRRLRWVLSLRAVSLPSKVSTVAFQWLGCRTVRIAVTLDTSKEYRGSSLFQMVRTYCGEIFYGLRAEAASPRT